MYSKVSDNFLKKYFNQYINVSIFIQYRKYNFLIYLLWESYFRMNYSPDKEINIDRFIDQNK